MQLNTQRLLIRNFELTDEDDLCEYMLQRVNAEFEAYPDFNREMAGQVVASRSKSDEFFAIELKESHKVIGNIYMGIRQFAAREMGYVLNEHYQGNGYASEAGCAMLAYAFGQGVRRVYAESTPLNIPSWRVMERIGLKREAHFRQNISFCTDEQGRPIYWDTYVYAALNPGGKDCEVALSGQRLL